MRASRIRLIVPVLLAVAFMVPAQADPLGECLGVTTNDLRSTDLDDFLTGTADRDVVNLGLGDDQYFAAELNDTVCGAEGNDVLVGEGGSDDLQGGPGDDLLAGLTAGDTLYGGGGSDDLRGGTGPDEIRAGVDEVRDDLYDGAGVDEIIGRDDDVWHRCDDGVADNHTDFTGLIIPDPDCP